MIAEENSRWFDSLHEAVELIVIASRRITVQLYSDEKINLEFKSMNLLWVKLDEVYLILNYRQVHRDCLYGLFFFVFGV
jgi:hypothetical protein